MYETMLKDNIITKLYNDISAFEDKDKGWAHHDLKHVTNVANMAESILEQLGYDKDYIDEAKVAALLHDMGCIQGKDNHPERSSVMAKKYLDDNSIRLKYEDEVISAIKNHSAGFEEDNIMTLCLIFCDKLDIKKSRVAKEGYNVIGMRQLQFIEDITISISNSNIEIDFVVDNAVDLKELEEFYFIEKVFKAIDSFSNKINRHSTVRINNKIWER